LLAPPEVAFGSQAPFEGGGYAGLIGFSLVTEDGRELIAVELTTPLTIGNSYLVEFKVSNFYFPDFVVTSNRLGFNFSSHPYYNLGGFPLNTSHYSEPDIIPITGEWHTISQLFIADSAYQYFHIGNFYDDDNTNYIADSPSPDLSYYAIDDVSVSIAVSNGHYEKRQRNIVTVFPNPSSEKVTVTLKNGDAIEGINVITYDGILVHSNVFNSRESSIESDISILPSGQYIIQVVTNKTTYNETLIKL
jgi:hypothetical protein